MVFFVVNPVKRSPTLPRKRLLFLSPDDIGIRNSEGIVISKYEFIKQCKEIQGRYDLLEFNLESIDNIKLTGDADAEATITMTWDYCTKGFIFKSVKKEEELITLIEETFQV